MFISILPAGFSSSKSFTQGSQNSYAYCKLSRSVSLLPSSEFHLSSASSLSIRCAGIPCFLIKSSRLAVTMRFYCRSTSFLRHSICCGISNALCHKLSSLCVENFLYAQWASKHYKQQRPVFNGQWH